MHVVIIPLLKCKSKDPADVNNYRPTAIATALSKVLEQVLLSRLARYRWTADSIIIIIIKKDCQCKVGRGRLAPYQSEDPSLTLPTYRGKEEKEKIVEDKKGESN